MAGLSLALLLVVGAVTWVVAQPEPYVAPAPERSTVEIDPAAASAALEMLESAIEGADEAGASALATPDDQASRALLTALADNAGRLRVTDFDLRYVDETSGLDADGRWSAAVDTTWRFDGFDQAPATTEVLFGFESSGDSVSIASVGGGDRRTPIWMGGPVSSRRTAETLVLVAGEGADLDAYHRQAQAAVPVVQDVLADWIPRLVVEVPADLDDLDRALDAEPGTYAEIAAVTTSVDGSLAPKSPIHVFVNPEIYGPLEPTGAQVVMSHEAVHVATGAPQSATPLWLLEGFADYIALRDVDLPVSVTAGQIIRQVRRDGPPASLPGPAEFDTNDTHLGASYESAWQACQVLVDRAGEAALVQLYEAVDEGGDLETELAELFSWTEADLVAVWQDRLTDLAA